MLDKTNSYASSYDYSVEHRSLLDTQLAEDKAVSTEGPGVPLMR